MSTSVLGKRTRASILDNDRSLPEAGRKRLRTSRQQTSFAIHEDSSNDTFCESLCISRAPSRNQRNLTSLPKSESLESGSALVNDSHVPDENVDDPHTPKAPRHRDALSKQLPVTPRHRVPAAGVPLTPQTPRTPVTSIRSVYSDARHAFDKCSNSSSLVGRANERHELTSFISQHLVAGKGGCLYVSGPPGTGKSALVGKVCEELLESHTIEFANVNCMNVQKTEDLYEALLSSMVSSRGDEKAGLEQVRHETLHCRLRSSPMLVILDEIDSLLNMDLSVMYSLFEWSMQKGSKLILVGIANALDLTDRFLPRLKARSLKPRLLPFLPYTVPEITAILTARARSLLPENTHLPCKETPIIANAAIELVSKKVAAQNGDIRKAFDIVQRVIGSIEKETYDNLSQQAAADQSPAKTPLGESLSLSSPISSPVKSPKRPKTAASAFAALSVETAPRATLSHVIRITSNTFNNLTSSRLKSLNLQQKAVLCALVALEQKGLAKQEETLPSPMATPTKRVKFSHISTSPSKRGSGPPSSNAVYDAYSTLCTRDNILHPLSRTEFRDVVNSLETLSLVSALGGKTQSGTTPATPSKKGRGTTFSVAGKQDERRISSVVDSKELQSAVEGVGAGVLSRMIVQGLD